MAHAWTQADLDLLRQHVEGGTMTYGQMTAIFPGRSRNALIGKALRCGFKQPPMPAEAKTVAPGRAHAPRRPKQHPDVKPARESIRVIAEDEESITIAMDGVQWEDANGNPVSDDAPIAVRRLELAELRADTCRWPIGARAPFLFCGDPLAGAGSPYCTHHHDMAYQKHKARKSERTHNPRKRSGLSFRYSFGGKAS